MSNKRTILIKNATLITVDDRDSIVRGDLLIAGDRIESVGGAFDSADDIIDGTGCAVIPGFVQTHIHLCQTLFRGFADDLSLIDWLKQRVWPMEAAHDAASLRTSAQLGIAEMIRGGTTCALTMETVNFTEEVFRVAVESGFRATIGKCMMDKGSDVPTPLQEQSDDSIQCSVELINQWNGSGNGRIRACFAPRFAISCSKALLERVGKLSREMGVMVHTHASESKQEIEMVEAETGKRNIDYLHSLGLTGPHVLLAHCVHVNESELELLTNSLTRVAHCPSSNLKLGSGIAPLKQMIDKGVQVSLGADGAPCNNRLDMFTEMRTAALLQKVLHDTTVIPAQQALRLATIEGARALGLEAEIGSLEKGKRADVAIVDLSRLHTLPNPPNVTSALVYSSMPGDVTTTIIDGIVVMRDRQLTSINEYALLQDVERQSGLLNERASAFRSN